MMKYYIDRATSELFAYEADGSQDEFIRSGLELLDDEGLAKVRAEQAEANAPTPEEILKSANTKRDSLLATASLRIAPLQDAVDLGESSDAEAVSLKAWKQYRVAVNRVSSQEGWPATVDWPKTPEGA